MSAPALALSPERGEKPLKCRVCGCTEERPCEPPCAWDDLEGDLCTTCDDAIAAIVEWAYAARRANRTALLREVKRRQESLNA
jgi:hypothetical protein